MVLITVEASKTKLVKYRTSIGRSETYRTDSRTKRGSRSVEGSASLVVFTTKSSKSNYGWWKTGSHLYCKASKTKSPVWTSTNELE
jgi:hypothetical protein